jgi:hypothetical protein
MTSEAIRSARRPRGPHADRLEAGSRTAASQSGLHTGTFTIAY